MELEFWDGTTSTTYNPVHTSIEAGRHMAILTATNSAGSNTATKLSYITVTKSRETGCSFFCIQRKSKKG